MLLINGIVPILPPAQVGGKPGAHVILESLASPHFRLTAASPTP